MGLSREGALKKEGEKGKKERKKGDNRKKFVLM